MKTTIFGATGRTGRYLVDQSLALGHNVTVLVRTPDKMTIQHPHLRVIAGDVLDPESVTEAVAGSNGVLCALGSSLFNPGTVISRGTQHIVRSMQQCTVKRIVAISAFGIGDSQRQLPFAARILGLLLGAYKAEKEAQEQIIRASALDWIIVRPWQLISRPQASIYQVELQPHSLQPVSHSDLADFMVRQLESDSWLRQTPTLVSASMVSRN